MWDRPSSAFLRQHLKKMNQYPYILYCSRPDDILAAAKKALVQNLVAGLHTAMKIGKAGEVSVWRGTDKTVLTFGQGMFSGLLRLRNGKCRRFNGITMTDHRYGGVSVNISYEDKGLREIFDVEDLPVESITDLSRAVRGLAVTRPLPDREPDPNTTKTYSCDVILPISLHLEGIPARNEAAARKKAREIAIYTDWCDWGDETSNMEVCNVEEETETEEP